MKDAYITRTIVSLAFAFLLATGIARSQETKEERKLTPYEIEAGGMGRIVPDPLNYTPQPFDVLHYDAALSLTAAPSKEMSGTCRITFRWTGEPTEGPFIFHLRLDNLVIDAAHYDDTPVTPTQVGDETQSTYHFEITPLPSAARGDTAVVTILYRGTMTDEFGPGRWGGVSSGGGVLYAMGVGFSNNYVSATQHWMPCYDHPSDKATFTGRFIVPSGMVVASNGLMTQHISADATELYEWSTSHPTATYLLTFAVAPFFELDFGTSELPMLVYARETDTALTRKSFKLLPRMVESFEQRFGPYPFEKVGYVNTPQGAMEHQTMVSFPTNLSRSGDSINTVGAHELAHQWFGDLVTPIDFRHAWLNESFATFCESLWWEELGDFTTYLTSQEAKLNDYISVIAPREGVLPLYDFSREAPSSNYPTTIYDKGAVIVGMLRYELGDGNFFEAMRVYLQRHAYGNAGTDDLQEICEDVSGQELDEFFDQWVRRAGWPVLEIDVLLKPGSNEGKVRMRQVQLPEYGIFKNVPVEIGFFTSSGIEYRVLRLNEAEQEFDIDLGEPFDDVIVNRGPSLRAMLQVREIRTLGVDNREEAKKARFHVAPNPLVGTSTLSIDREGEATSKPATLRLYDSSGRRIHSDEINRFPHIFETDSIPSGRYIIQIVEEGDSHIIPIMIER